VSTNDPEKGNIAMSAKMRLAALAALLTSLSVQGIASAQNYFPTFPSSASEYRTNQGVNRFKGKIPSNAFGSVNDRAGTRFGQSPNDVVFNGKTVGRDPDANVRLQILRDDQYAASR
jgi:hypothetical protein